MDNEKVPEWAWTRMVDEFNKARELSGLPRMDLTSGDFGPANVGYSFARYIAEHEDPPVDPLEQAVDNAFVRLPLEWTRETFVKAVADSLRADGVTRNPTREDSHAG